MMLLRRFLTVLTFVLAVSASGYARAQSDQRMALATELVQLMRIEESLGSFFDTMSPMVAEQMARDLHLGPVESARLGELVAEEFRAALPSMTQEMAGVYARQMTEPQLDESVRFLRSPTGLAFVQTQFNAQTELERIGAMAGARVSLQALTRFQQERTAQQGR